MTIPWRRGALSLAFVLLVPLVARAADPVPLDTTPLQLDRHDPGRTQVGKLVWRGGLVLRGHHRDFGGYSGLRIEQDGKKLRAVSDTGTWLTLDLAYDAKGMLTGASNALSGPLHGSDGSILRGKVDTDAESMAVLPDGSVLIGFEQKHRIWRYPPGAEASGGGMAGTPRSFAAPPGISAAPANAGLEGATVLPDGRLLLISEGLKRTPDAVAAWIGTPSPDGWHWQDARYPIVGRFRPSDTTALPNGDVVVLERSYTPLEGVRVRVMRLRGADITAGGIFHPELLAVLQSPVITENLEGVSALPGPDGEIRLWLIADDNFNPLQRTILLHFALAD